MSNNKIISDKNYANWLKQLKEKVRSAQLKAAVKINTELLNFYWELGKDIVEKQKDTKWGSGFLKQLSKDLIAEFPKMKGFSEVNLQHIRRWFLFYNKKSNSITSCYEIESKIVDDLIRIPWGHNIVIISKCKTIEDALFYVDKTIENGWSRSVLTHQIEAELNKKNNNL